MARKALRLLLLASLAALAASQWQEIVRYVKIARMSVGGGDPKAVPASGVHAYPDRPGAGVPDGTGDFDSASRGGPAAASHPAPPPRASMIMKDLVSNSVADPS
jgi:hypothetical protein